MTKKYPISEARTPSANRQIGELLGLGFTESELHFILADDGVTELVASDRDSILAFLRRTRLPLHVAKAVADFAQADSGAGARVVYPQPAPVYAGLTPSITKGGKGAESEESDKGIATAFVAAVSIFNTRRAASITERPSRSRAQNSFTSFFEYLLGLPIAVVLFAKSAPPSLRRLPRLRSKKRRKQALFFRVENRCFTEANALYLKWIQRQAHKIVEVPD